MRNNAPFPIDAVYLWVDGDDPQWSSKKEKVVRGLHESGDQLQDDVASKGRFVDNGELKYSLRSLCLYAPWINNIYLVTDSQHPEWVNRDKVEIIDHKDIFPQDAALPCFNSHAIELCVHRIKGLSEHFLLFNDDFFLGSTIERKAFFRENGDPVLWVLKKRKKYRGKLLSEEFMQMNAHRGADVYARRLAFETYGRYLPYRVRHYPKPMRRSAMEEIWNTFPEEVERTLSGQFRKANDLAIITFFTFYMIAEKNIHPRCINGSRLLLDYSIGRTRHITATAGDKNFGKRLKQIEKQKPLTFCINDGETSTDGDRQTTKRFLEKRFPEKSIYEN